MKHGTTNYSNKSKTEKDPTKKPRKYLLRVLSEQEQEQELQEELNHLYQGTYGTELIQE